MKKVIKTMLCLILSLCMLFVVACDNQTGTTPPDSAIGGGGNGDGGNSDGDTTIPEVIKPTASKLIEGGKTSLDNGNYTITFEMSDDDSTKFILNIANGEEGYIDSFKLTTVSTTIDDTVENAQPVITTQIMFIYGNNTLYTFDSVDADGVEYFTASVMEDKLKASKIIDFVTKSEVALVENEDGSYTVKTQEDLTNKINMYYKLVSGNLDKTFQQLLDILLGGDGDLTEYYAMLNPIVTALSALYNNPMPAVISMIDTQLMASELSLEMVLSMIPNAYEYIDSSLSETLGTITDYASFLVSVDEVLFHTFVEKMVGLEPMQTADEFKVGLVTLIDATINSFTYGTVGETIEAYSIKFGKNYHEYLNKMIELETKIETIKFGGELMFDKDEKFTGFKFSADIVIDNLPKYFEGVNDAGEPITGFESSNIDKHSFVALSIDYTTQVEITLPSDEQIVVPATKPDEPTTDPTLPTDPSLPTDPNAPVVQSDLVVKSMLAKLTNNYYSYI